MLGQKYDDFKSLGNSVLSPDDFEIIKPHEDEQLAYDLISDELQLTKLVNINNVWVTVHCLDNDTERISSKEFYFIIEGRKENVYFIRSDEKGINFCLENEIITSAENVDRGAFSSLYKVEFNELLGVEFEEIPANITRHFRDLKPRPTVPHGVMFVDLELGMI